MSTPQTADFSKVLDKVRKLIAKAQGTDNVHEAQAFQAAADKMMLDYAISEAMVDEARPAAERTKPVVITIMLGKNDDFTGWIATMADHIARHTRCRIRLYADYTREGWTANVYGFESDARYFELLFTEVQLHMLGVLLPKIDPAKSLEDNAYRLHNAGYNWWDIAELYGWRGPVTPEPGEPKLMYQNKVTGERASWAKAVGVFKNAYNREIKARGEQPVRIPPTGSKTYRDSAAMGYVSRIAQRLREAKKGMTGNGAELVLANREQDLEDFYRESHPRDYTRCPECGKLSADKYDCDRCGHKMAERPDPSNVKTGRTRRWKEAPFNHGAYMAGVAHANTADLFGSKVGPTVRRGVEG